jgi:hypothetical protein
MTILSIRPGALQHLNANLCDLLILPFKMVSCVGESSHAGFQQARRGGQFDSGGAATRRVCNLKITKRLPHQRQSADNLITSWRVLALGVIQKTVYTRRTDGRRGSHRSSSLVRPADGEEKAARVYTPSFAYRQSRHNAPLFVYLLDC